MFRTRPLAQLLRHAIAKRQANELQRLLAAHGLVPFTAALASWSPRVVADGLSQLPADARAPVLRHLPRPLRDEVQCSQRQSGQSVGRILADGFQSATTPSACDVGASSQAMQAGKSVAPGAIERQGGLVQLPLSSTLSPSINVAAADIVPAGHIAQAPVAEGYCWTRW